jgi:RimJ/RimL family protein N-acetyltransferase
MGQSPEKETNVGLNIRSQFKSERLWMRPYRIGDESELQMIFLENREHLAEAIAGVLTGLGLDVTTLEGATRYVLQLAADWAAHRRFVLGIWLRSTGQYVGELWIEGVDWQISLHEIGYYVVEDRIGQGFATEAVQTGLAFIFNDLDADKVRITCAADNLASALVAKRCGFREIRPDNGVPANQRVFGMIRAEFERMFLTGALAEPPPVSRGN